MSEVHTIPYGNLYIQDTDGNGVFQIHSGDKVFDRQGVPLSTTQALEIDPSLNKTLGFFDENGEALNKSLRNQTVALGFTDPTGAYTQVKASTQKVGVGWRVPVFGAVIAASAIWFFGRDDSMRPVTHNVQAMTIDYDIPPEWTDPFDTGGEPDELDDPDIDESDDEPHVDPDPESDDEDRFEPFVFPKAVSFTNSSEADDDDAPEVDGDSDVAQADDEEIGAEESVEETLKRYGGWGNPRAMTMFAEALKLAEQGDVDGETAEWLRIADFDMISAGQGIVVAHRLFVLGEDAKAIEVLERSCHILDIEPGRVKSLQDMHEWIQEVDKHTLENYPGPGLIPRLFPR